MANYRYLFGNWQTAMVDVEIPLYGVYITDRLNDVGYMQGSFQLDQTGKSNDILVEATAPGRSFAVVLRDGLVIWGGYITSRTYQSQAKSIQLYARGYEGYFDERIFPIPGLHEEHLHGLGEQDQAYHFNTLVGDFVVDETTAGPLFPLFFEPGSIPADISSGDTPTGIIRDIDVHRHDYKTYKQVIDEMANGDDGFDWKVVPRLLIGSDLLSDIGPYNPGPNTIQVHKFVQFGFPFAFVDLSHDAFVFEYPGNILNYYRTDNLSGAGTTVIGLGAGQGEEMLVKEFEHTDLVNAVGGFFPRDVVVPMKHIDDQGVLDSRTNQEAVKRRPPKVQYKVTVRPGLSPVFGTYGLGSPATLIIKDPMHPTGSQVQVRVNEYALTPPSEEAGAEEVALGFVGESE